MKKVIDLVSDEVRIGMLYVVTFSIGIGGLVYAFTPAAPPKQTVPHCLFKVDVGRIVDADTIIATVIRFPWGVALADERVRLAGFDAWEDSKFRFGQDTTEEELAKGALATEALKKLIDQYEYTWLQPYPLSTSAKRGAYGRPEAMLFLSNEDMSDVLNVAAWMRENGHDRNPESN